MLNIKSLLLPENHANIPQNYIDDDDDKNPIFLENGHRLAIDELIKDQKRLTDDFYEDCSTATNQSMHLEKMVSSPGLRNHKVKNQLL